MSGASARSVNITSSLILYICILASFARVHGFDKYNPFLLSTRHISWFRFKRPVALASSKLITYFSQLKSVPAVLHHRVQEVVQLAQTIPEVKPVKAKA